MASFGHWMLVVLAALVGVAGDLHIDFSALAEEECCEDGGCCCAAEEPSCCSADEPAGPRIVPACGCGEHGQGAVYTVHRSDWMLTDPLVLGVAPERDARRSEEWFPTLTTHSFAPDVPPPRR